MKTTKWIGYNFNTSGWSETHENKNEAFPQFVRDFRSDVNSLLKDTDWKIVELKKGYFYVSGFLYNSLLNKYVYLLISDVRHWMNEWNSNILVRSAQNTTDWTGGRNHFTTLKDLKESLESARNWF